MWENLWHDIMNQLVLWSNTCHNYEVIVVVSHTPVEVSLCANYISLPWNQWTRVHDGSLNDELDYSMQVPGIDNILLVRNHTENVFFSSVWMVRHVGMIPW